MENVHLLKKHFPTKVLPLSYKQATTCQQDMSAGKLCFHKRSGDRA